MTVNISGKEAAPVARLLEVLTKSGLLNERAVWREVGMNVVINVTHPTDRDIQAFQSKRQYDVEV